MAKAKTNRRGMRPTLSPNDPDPAKAALARKGFSYVTEAAKRVGMSLGRFNSLVIDGLSDDPKASTLEKLKPLGEEFLAAVRKKTRARSAG